MATYYVDGDVGDNGNLGTSEGSGNAWATIQYASDNCAAGDTIYVKASATYNEMVSPGVEGTITEPIRYIGYTTSTTDGGRATIDAQNTRAHCIDANTTDKDYLWWKNFIFTGATAEAVYGSSGSIRWHLENTKITDGTGSPTVGIYQLGEALINNCEVENCSSHGIEPHARSATINCNIHNNGGCGIYIANYRGNQNASGNIIYDNTSDGIYVGTNNHLTIVEGNTCYNNGGDGIEMAHQNSIAVNNLLANNTGKGLNCTYDNECDYNAFYSNTGGSYATNDLGKGSHDVAITDGSPFTDVSGANRDLSLNATALRGALCRNAGFPGAFQGGETTGHIDIGAVQHADPAPFFNTRPNSLLRR